MLLLLFTQNYFFSKLKEITIQIYIVEKHSKTEINITKKSTLLGH